MPKQAAGDTPDTGTDNSTVAGPGKNAPTPSRKQQEEARKKPLVPNDRKEAAKASRAKVAADRERARIGMAAGDERFLPVRDRGPQKRYVRDYVDARWSVGEFILPVMFIFIVITFIPDPFIQYYGIFVLWGFVLIAAIDSVILGAILTRRLKAKYGEDKVEKVRWYAAMRALQMRPIRLPKPQVKRGQYPS